MERINYNKEYILEAFFKLLETKSFEDMRISDIVKKAGVSRVTFYRNYESKEDIVRYFLKSNTDKFINEKKYIDRTIEDYKETITSVFNNFKKHKEEMFLIVKNHLEYLYIDYINEMFSKLFDEKQHGSIYSAYAYAGSLFNISLLWLKRNCEDPIEELVDSILKICFH